MSTAVLVSQILLWIGFLGLVLVMAAMLRQLGVLFERVAPAGALSMNSRLEVGTKSPDFNLQSLSGKNLQVGPASEDGKSTLLFFLSVNCPVCKELLPALKSFQKHESAQVNVLYIGSGQEAGHEENAAKHHIPSSDYIISDEIGMAFAVSKLPYGVLIDENGKIAAFGLVNNREHLESLLEAKIENVASIQDYLAKRA